MSKPDDNDVLIGAFMPASPDDRRTAILAAALDVFMRYGFSRTTMDDIARAANLSRPLLYREFRNKADIYVAIARTLLDRSAGEARAVLLGDAQLETRLEQALEAGFLQIVTVISQSPHGAEILELKGDMTRAILSDWMSEMIAAIADAIEREARARKIDLPSRGLSGHGLAETIIDGIEGAKLRSDDPEAWRATARRLVCLAALALR